MPGGQRGPPKTAPRPKMGCWVPACHPWSRILPWRPLVLQRNHSANLSLVNHGFLLLWLLIFLRQRASQEVYSRLGIPIPRPHSNFHLSPFR